MKQLIAALCLFMGMTVVVKAQTVMETLESQSDLSTFVSAVKAAGLSDALNAQDITVFAPSNDAFAALEPGSLESLMMPENKDKLAKLLTNHIVPGKMTSDQITDGKVLSQDGEEVDLTVSDSGVMFNNATVTTADVAASNGVIHIIDGVVMPASQLKN